MASGKRIGKKSQASNDFLEPLAPTSVTATDVGTGRAFNNGAVNITWSLPALSPAATSYNIIYAVCVGGVCAAPNVVNTGSASTSYTLAGLTGGSTVEVRVSASNAAGTSGASAASSGVINVTTVPQAPTNASVTSTVANQDSVQWTAPATGGSAITSYTVTSSDSATNPPRTSATSPSVFNEVGGTSQTYTIVAINANGTSAGTTTGSITTLPPFFPPFFPPYFPPFFPPFFPPYFPPFFPPYFPPFFPPFFPPYFPPYFVPPFFPPFFPPYFPPYFVPPFFPPFFPPYFPPYFVPPFFPPYFVPPYFVPPFFPPYFVPPYFPPPFFPPYFVPPSFGGGCPTCYSESNCPSLWCFCTGPCAANCVC
jgi:hypothetical protein